MRDYTLSELTVGLKEEFTTELTQEMQETFMELTGDVNPMHTDDAYAASNGYRERILYGMLTSSFYSTLAGCYLPGKYCVLQEVSIAFASPAYAGDKICVSGTVAQVYEELKRVKIKVRIQDQNGRCISRGHIIAGVLR